MSSVKLSKHLYHQLGLKSWYLRKPFSVNKQNKSGVLSENEQHKQFAARVVDEHKTNLANEAAIKKTLQERSFSDDEMLGSRLNESHNNADENASQTTPEVLVSNTSPLTKAEHQENALVLLGSGLDSIWENEDELAWQLWQNIAQALGWQDKSVVFYDLDCLVSDDALINTMEEVIDLSVDWVLSMQAEHILCEQLSEGVQVIEVPDLESMLSDPYAKQMFYQTVVQNT